MSSIPRPQTFLLALSLGTLLTGCGERVGTSTDDAGSGPASDADILIPDSDAAVDSGLDGGIVDSGIDAGTDAGAPDSGHDAGTPDTGPTLQTGQILGGPGPFPGPIAGLHYRSSAGEGTTDSSGNYPYFDGVPVSFSIGEVSLATIPGAARHTPFALASDAPCAATADLKHLLVLLESLDSDRDPTNGVTLPALATSATPTALSSLTDSTLAAEIDKLAPGAPVANADAALHRFITQVDSEEWAETGVSSFTGTDFAYRSQGLASDGTNVWFSWMSGLQRTDMNYAIQVKSVYDIPLTLALSKKSDHIGDIDVYNGVLYAPIEDGKNGYKNPLIALYDPQSLNYKNQYFAISTTLLTQGVPWVAYDGPRSLVYVAEWNPTPGIHILDPSNSMAYLRTLALSRTLTRIQGAKVYRSMLFANSDDSQKGLYKINLETGTVIDLLQRTTPMEVEGIAFWPAADGSFVHSMVLPTGANSTELHHYQRSREPLREQVCPGG